VSSVACTAVGQTGFSQSIIEAWDGTSWTSEAASDAPGAHSTNLAGVACTDNSRCTAVGFALYDSGDGTYLTFAEQSNASGWNIQSSFNPLGATSHALAAVSCATPQACTAVGEFFDASGKQLPLAEQWDGHTWHIQSVTPPSGALASNFGGVSCTTANDCTAVGSFADSGGNGGALVEHWDGADWQYQATPTPVGSSASVFNAVSCTAATVPGDHSNGGASVCTAVGASVDTAGSVTTLVERGSVAGWQIQPSPNPDGAVFAELFGVSCPIARECTAVGLAIGASFSFLTLAEAWDGASWKIQASPNPVGADGVNGTLDGGVSCPTARQCTAVGEFSPSPAPHPGVTLAERWNGAVWQVQHTPNPGPVEGVNGTRDSPFAGVSCASVITCVAVGNYDSGNSRYGFLTLAERWNGTEWSLQQSPSPIGASVSQLGGVSCPTPQTCIAVGQSRRFNAETASQGRPVALAERYVAIGE
jgi:hypothetical protein